MGSWRRAMRGGIRRFLRILPTCWKRARPRRLSCGRWMIRIFYLCLVLSLGLAAMSLYGGIENGDLLRYVAQVVVALQVGIVALVAPSLTSASISSEIENGTWELLRLTPRGGGEIFAGKLLPSLVPALLLPNPPRKEKP